VVVDANVARLAKRVSMYEDVVGISRNSLWAMNIYQNNSNTLSISNNCFLFSH